MEGPDPATRAKEKFYRFQWELLIALFNITEEGKISHIASGYIFTEID